MNASESINKTRMIKSAWITASAGSGKTRAVIDRIKLLMNDSNHKTSSKEGQVLCLAFTKAAAAEMRERTGDLSDSKVKVSIQTFHSYCMELVRKYADILDIANDFNILNDTEATIMQHEAITRAIIDLQEDAALFMQYFSYHYLREACFSIINTVGFSVTHSVIKEAELVSMEQNAKRLKLIETILAVDVSHDSKLCWPTDAKAKRIMEYATELLEARPARGKKLPDNFIAHIEQVRDAAIQIATMDTECTSSLLTKIATYAQKYYQTMKAEAAVCDFNDAINMTLYLLAEHPFRDTVRYWLHQNIQHLIIDEAQDLTPTQWKIIELICEDFFTDQESRKTVFAVGDTKQSIYSFLDAKPELFLHMGNFFAERAQQCGVGFEFIILNKSYRSCPKILHFIDRVFAGQSAKNALKINAPLQHITTLANNKDSIVEIMPLAKSMEQVVDSVVSKIKCYIYDGTPASSIMILVRRRSEFEPAIAAQLANIGISSSINHSIPMLEEPVIADLVAVGRILIAPESSMLHKHSRARLTMLDCDIGSIAAANLNCAVTFYSTAVALMLPVLCKRYGPGAEDVANKFLDLALRSPSSVEEFLAQLSPHHKIEYEAKGNLSDVRILTIHGAKGLQAPIVFIVDDCKLPPGREQVMYARYADDPLLRMPVCYRKCHELCALVGDLAQQGRQQTIDEYYRLLYVALTRAENALYFHGWSSHKGVGTECWYSLIRESNAEATI